MHCLGKIFLIVLLMSGMVFMTTPLPAEQNRTQTESDKNEDTDEQAGPPEIVTTSHVLKTKKGVLRYTARAGELSIPAADREEEAARIFFVAYELKDAAQKERPLTFAFNGGPGAASVWLHLGCLGPRIVEINQDGTAPAPPARLKDNRLSWLNFTDLVFIDPVGTGYSRSLDAKTDKNQYWGVEKDVQSVARFIRLYLTEQKRWLSPKFLVGESYGTTRAAALTTHLDKEFGIRLNGAVLISPALDFGTLDVHNGRNLPYALFLPTYAATAAHHDKAGGPDNRSLEDVLDRAENFAWSGYLKGLFKGGELGANATQALNQRTAELTGLDRDLIKRHRARIPPGVLRKELLKDQGLVIGRMDTTLTGIDPNPGSAGAAYDPSMRSFYGPFSSGINAYIRQELEYETRAIYEFLNFEVNRKWDWCRSIGQKGLGQGYVNAAQNLKKAMTMNTGLDVFVACGLFDLATPYFATEYTINQMHLDWRIRDNLSLVHFRAGHMIYLHQKARKKLYRGVREFYVRFASGKSDTITID